MSTAKKSTPANKGNDQLEATHVNKFDWKKWNAGLSDYVFGRQQPQAIELEEAILGAVLQDSAALRRLAHILTPEMFYLEAHQVIYRSMLELNDDQVPVDLLTVANILRTKQLLDQVGGSMALVELTNRVASSANIEYHARIIAQKHLSREAIRLFANGIKALYEEGDDVFTVRNYMSDELRVMPFTSYLRVRDANTVLEEAASMPDLKQLAGTLLQQQDVSLFFAQPGVGKSIFAVQIADAVSRGQMVFPEGILPNEAGAPMRTGFFDFELLDKEFFNRYTDKTNPDNPFQFSENFFRIDINPNFTDFPDGDIESYILREIENAVITNKLEFIVIDNITALLSTGSHDPNVALRVMASLKKLRVKYSLTLLVLAHTTKIYNKTKSLEMEDMAGAAALQNFAPTIFAIGRDANDAGMLYFKQVKGRNGCLFGPDNVIKAEIHKRDGNFLAFQYRGQAREADLLAEFLDDNTQDHLIREAIDHQRRTGDGLRRTAEAIGWAQSHTTLGKRIAEFKKNAIQPEFRKEQTKKDPVESPKLEDPGKNGEEPPF